MKLGTESRNKTIAAGGLLVVALLLVVRMFSGGSAPAAAAPPAKQAQAPARRNRPRGRTGPPAVGDVAATATLDPRLQLGLLRQAESTEYKGTGRDIFRAQAEPPEIPKPVVPPDKQAQNTPPPPQPNPGPPPPAPINLKFFGFANRPGQPRQVFLSQGADVFIAGEGDIVKGRYKVLHIGANTVEVQDVLSNNPPQTIPLTQG